jgi:hypothetical protein
MASAAFKNRMKLELGTETVRKMEKAETMSFVTEEGSSGRRNRSYLLAARRRRSNLPRNRPRKRVGDETGASNIE